MSICIDHLDQLWIGTIGGGLNKFNPSTKQFDSYMHIAADSTSLSDNYVNAVYEDNNGALWIGTNVGLDRLDRATKTFTHIDLMSGNSENSIPIRVLSICSDKNDNLWIGTEQGLYMLSTRAKVQVHFQHDHTYPNTISNNFFFLFLFCFS